MVVAEVAGEALQEEVDELSTEVQALRNKLDAKSLVGQASCLLSLFIFVLCSARALTQTQILSNGCNLRTP